MKSGEDSREPTRRHVLGYSKRWFLGGIRIRLMLWYMLTTTLVLLLFGGLLYSTIAKGLPSLNNNTLANTLQQGARAYAKDGTFDRSEAPDTVLLLDRQGAVVKAWTADRQVSGDLLLQVQQFIAANPNVGAACGILHLPVKSSVGTRITTQDDDICLTALLSHGQQIGTLVGMQRSNDNQAILANLAKSLLLIGLAVLLVMTIGGYWLATRAMRPVRLITRTAREIGQTDLSRRLHLGSRDELGELAATFDGMLNRLQDAFDRLRQFTADASHELRTPLSIMSLAASRALSKPYRPESYKQALDMGKVYRQELSVIQAEIEHMTRLVNDLLTLARADTGQTALTKEEIDVSEVLLDVVERLAPLARERGVELILGELPEIPINGDRTYLTMMITNLLNNALKYTSRLDPRVQIEGGTDLSGRGGWGWTRVKDNGPGIDPEHLPHLFERFYRVDRARLSDQEQRGDAGNNAPSVESSGGSGLGLSIVQWVAQAHGGEVHVQSEVGEGSVFEVRLPLLQPTKKTGNVLAHPSS
jgi:signal transduction histidine kinase